LNDTLVDLINTAAIADAKPTEQAIAVSQEIMARVDAEIAKLDLLLSTDISNINRWSKDASIEHILSTR
jgi:hypothetical protein